MGNISQRLPANKEVIERCDIRIVLLLNQASLGVDLDSERANVLSPVEGVRPSVEENEHTTISKGSDTDDSLASVDVKSVGVERGPSGGEVVSNALVDEVKGEDRLERVLGRNLTLIENAAVFGPARFRSDVRLNDGSAEDGEVGIGSLRCELLGDKAIEPGGGDGVLLEV